MVSRATPDAPVDTVLMAAEAEVLDRLGAGGTPTPETPAPKRTVCHYLVEIAKLGGYLTVKTAHRRATW